MTVRRMLTLLSVLAMVMAGCGDAGDAGDNGATGADPEPPTDDDLGLRDPGVLLVGSALNFAPFEFVEDNEEQGFDIDLMDEIGSRLGVEVEYVDANFDTIFQQLAAGDFDAVISATTITEERAETVAFTDPYFEATQALVVPGDSDIVSVDDLAGKDVGAQAGTTGLEYANEHFTESTITEFPDYPAAFTALETGGLDAVLADLAFADEGVRESDTLQIVEEIDTDEQYGIAVQQENETLLEAINQALADIVADGTYEAIFDEWFPEAEIPERFQGGDSADS